MSCRFAHDDGAYVLGALSPGDRREFERHLAGCADCTRAVAELAGLPGLLGRVDASVVEREEVDDPLPATLLPALSREVGRDRRRRAVGLAAAAAVAVTAGIAIAVGQAGPDQAAVPPVPGASSDPADPESTAGPPLRMRPVGDVPVRATVTLEQVTWGTRLGLACTYDPTQVEYELPSEVDYTLFVRTRDGRAERVGSWRSVDGVPMRLDAATSATLEELTSVEVRTTGGRVVLRLVI